MRKVGMCARVPSILRTASGRQRCGMGARGVAARCQLASRTEASIVDKYIDNDLVHHLAGLGTLGPLYLARGTGVPAGSLYEDTYP